MRSVFEFLAIVWPVALILLVAAAPLLWQFCWRWMAWSEEPSQDRIEYVNPVSSIARAGRPESL